MSARVMLVDDEDDIRFLLRTALRREDEIQVVGEAHGGHEAVALAGAIEPDVIVLDNQMPGMSGLAALPLIRTTAPEARVLFFTAFEDDEHRVEAMAAGATMFLGKSTDIVDVVAAVRDLAHV